MIFQKYSIFGTDAMYSLVLTQCIYWYGCGVLAVARDLFKTSTFGTDAVYSLVLLLRIHGHWFCVLAAAHDFQNMHFGH